MPVTNLRFNITSSWDGGGLRRASGALGGMSRSTERLNRRLSSGFSSMGGLAKVAALLAPAMFTLAKAGLALGGGLLTLGAAAAFAAAPWIGLAITAAKNSDEMGKAGAAYERATGRVRDAWMDLARKTAPLTLGPMTDVLEGVAKAIPKLEPLVRSIAPVFADMGRAIRGWLEGPGFERFIDNVRRFGVPAFRNLVNAGRDFLATVGVGFRSFLPLAVDISEAIERGTARMRDWAEGGGFDRFLRNVRAEWPTVRRFLQEAGESLGNIGQVLDDIGPGQLDLLSGALEKFNEVDVDGWKDFLLTLGGLKIGGGLLSLIGGLANIRGGQLQFQGAGALLGAAGALSAAGGTLLSAAAALQAAAASLSGAGASSALGSAAGGILGGLGARLAGGSTTFTVTIVPANAATTLTTIRDRIAELNGRTATFTVTLNATAFTTAVGQVTAAWGRVRASAAVPATFRATASAGNVSAVAGQVIAAWGRVRAAAATVPVFRATASAGNVSAVAGQVIAAWGRVRAAAATVPQFRATASAGNVPGVAQTIVSAWQRVVSAAGNKPVFTATANTGQAVSAAGQAVSAWRRVLAMPRSWSATATVNAGAAVAGANAARSAWASVLAMPRSVTFTVNIVQTTTQVTRRIGGGGAFAKGGPVRGTGGPTSDRIPLWASDGEYVVRAAAARELGPRTMAAINSVGSGGGGGGGHTVSLGGRSDSGPAPHVHIHGDVYAKSSAEFEDMLAEAMQNLKRRNRLPR